MAVDLTVLTPIAPSHLAAFGSCEASVRAQTVAVEHLYQIDSEGRGPGAVRNDLLKHVATPYVTFLDADDWLEPTFAEQTLAFLRTRRDRYCFTDWLQDGVPITAPDVPWTQRTFHLVTAVVPTSWARQVGGFDESLSGMEDTDFYLKLVTRGMPGCRLALPLVNYRAGGGRAQEIHTTGEAERLQEEMTRRYGGMIVGCCGDPSEPDLTPLGERREGDVLAMALWGGNRSVMGLATGRHYPRTGNGKQEWVDPRDVGASPNLWWPVPDEAQEPGTETSGQLTGVAALEAALMSDGYLRAAVAQPVPAAPVPVTPIPNIGKLRRLAAQVYGDMSYPTFVMPRQNYPSYTDFWMLAELSGFELLYQDEADLGDERQTYIFAAPEVIPDCTGASARTIFWQMEYAGRYTVAENAHTVDEVWSSDPGHAARVGARYVILGSHRGLNPTLDRSTDVQYDLTMLAYLVDRRRAVQERLRQYTWAPDYPGHAGTDQRHDVLCATRLMLHVHQHEEAALSPLRLAIAAAYRLPVISEDVPNRGDYSRAVLFASYQELPMRVREFFEGKLDEAGMQNDALYQLLCVEHPFRDEVMHAMQELRQAEVAA